eukprot:Phypoly_transcript_13690.p1 GENE.Phypoly_transcript_13690~~Phypoly_transcript_13690.p1  ORF type:complete len:143 (+),score=14.77 Phypoly_transcript_13690:332-760(+)
MVPHTSHFHPSPTLNSFPDASYLSDLLITNLEQLTTSPYPTQSSNTTKSTFLTVSLATATSSPTKDLPPTTKFSLISFTQQFPLISKNNWCKQMNKLLNFVNELPSPLSLSLATISCEALSQTTKDHTTSIHSAFQDWSKHH